MAVAATGQWRDPDDGVRAPAGEVHRWDPGRNETTCGLSLSRSGLVRFPHVRWEDVQPASGGRADAVADLCPRCSAVGRPKQRTSWRRESPRP